MEHIVLIHGFAATGNPQSHKAQVLRAVFPGITLHAPTIAYHEPGWFGRIEALVQTLDKPLLVGNSLGGFAALALSRNLGLPAILVNPALEPWMLLAGLQGVQTNFDTGNPFEWAPRATEYLQEIWNQAPTGGPNTPWQAALLGTQDTLLDVARSKVLLEAMQIRWFEFPDDHRFNARFEEGMRMLVKELEGGTP
jgi:predicted esterase YcpF (UPF0227 family)